MPDFFTAPTGRRIAYQQSAGKGPGIVFLGGFMSDMAGTKAVALEAWAQAQGRAFLRFDYSGHGQSDGAFENGAIGDWAADARGIIEALTSGPQILVGSSMGGWISLILAAQIPEKIAGLVGIAAAPDFTEDGFWASFDADQRAELAREGRVMVPSDYDAPYPITQRLIEEGRDHLVLRKPMDLPFPVRLLQGTADADVDISRPLAILDHATCEDMRLTLVKGADHRFSTPECLRLIEKTVEKVIARVPV
ncbi:MAG: alpha/beta fold hydrolase [Paracoccaceae bacterium]